MKSEHYGEKNYNCDFCEKSFTRRDNLKNHINLIHIIKNIKCNFCEECFSTFGALKSHVNVIHAEPLGLTADTIGPAILPAIKPKQPNFENLNFKLKGTAIPTTSKHVNCHICQEKILVSDFTKHCQEIHGKKCYLAPPKDVPENIVKTISISKKDLKCEICGDVCDSNENLSKHMGFVHGLQVKIGKTPIKVGSVKIQNES